MAKKEKKVIFAFKEVEGTYNDFYKLNKSGGLVKISEDEFNKFSSAGAEVVHETYIKDPEEDVKY